jgi:hypothetical protein
MTARLLLLALALAPLALAAPAPFLAPATPPQREVELRGTHPVADSAGRVPQVITTDAAYLAEAEALGVKNPPPVNFRTHFLFVLVAPGYVTVNCEIVGGDLRAAGGLRPQARDGLRPIRCGKAAMYSAYLIKSFRRSAVKTVNGRPLQRD